MPTLEPEDDTPEIHAEVAEQPATTPTTPSAPPLRDWVSEALLSLIDSAPANPSLRGLIRAELSIIVPAVIMAAPSSAAIRDHLTANFTAFAASPSGIDYIRRTTPQPTRTPPIRSATTATAATTPGGAVPTIRRNAAGHILVEGIALQGTQAGSAQFTNRVNYRGAIHIPEATIRAGHDAINTWLFEHRDELRADTFQYDYTDYEMDGAPNIEEFGRGNLDGIVNVLAAATPEATPTLHPARR